MLLLLGLTTAPVVLWAQDSEEPPDAPFNLGPVGLSPTIRQSQAGWDSNVFYRNQDDRPTGDMTATLTPALDASIRLSRVRVSSHNQVDLYFFRRYDHLNAADTESAARAEFQLSRLTPFASGRLLRTRHRQGLEIDAITERREDELQVGADLRITPQASIGVYRRRSHWGYEAGSLFRETDLAHALNRAGTTNGFVVRYAATPLTTLFVNIEQHRDQFVSSPERNSSSLRIEPSVEFKPLALVSGRAAVGFRRRTFSEVGTRTFKGTVASVDLHYTLLGRTLFTVGARRDLEYSYLNQDYLYAGYTLAVTHRLGESWDVGGSVGRFRLRYLINVLQGADSNETTMNSGLTFGYKIGPPARVGFYITQDTRTSEVARRYGYDRLRVGSSVSYNF